MATPRKPPVDLLVFQIVGDLLSERYPCYAPVTEDDAGFLTNLHDPSSNEHNAYRQTKAEITHAAGRPLHELDLMDPFESGVLLAFQNINQDFQQTLRRQIGPLILRCNRDVLEYQRSWITSNTLIIGAESLMDGEGRYEDPVAFATDPVYSQRLLFITILSRLLTPATCPSSARGAAGVGKLRISASTLICGAPWAIHWIRIYPGFIVALTDTSVLFLTRRSLDIAFAIMSQVHLLRSAAQTVHTTVRHRVLFLLSVLRSVMTPGVRLGINLDSWLELLFKTYDGLSMLGGKEISFVDVTPLMCRANQYVDDVVKMYNNRRCMDHVRQVLVRTLVRPGREIAWSSPIMKEIIRNILMYIRSSMDV